MVRRLVIEPGVLPVLRFFLTIQWIILTIGLWPTAFNHVPPPDLIAVSGWWMTTLLLLYLTWQRLQYWLQGCYLPLLLLIAAITPIVAYAVSIAWHMRHNHYGMAAAIAPSILYLWLLLPMILIGIQYQWRVLLAFTVGTTLLTIILAIPLTAAGGPPIAPILQDAVTRCLIYSVAGGVIVWISQAQRKYREMLAQQQVQLAQYATTVEQLTVSRERNRLARELHDTLAHTMSAVSVQLDALDVLWETDAQAARQLLRQTHALTRSGLDEARRALQALRANPIEELGFAGALRYLATSSAAQANMDLTLTLPLTIIGLRPEVEQQIYRITEEALHNVVRHANAHTLTLLCTWTNADLLLAIADDGQGFIPASLPPTGHYGLTGMRERAAIINAMVVVESQPNQGTLVQIRYQA